MHTCIINHQLITHQVNGTAWVILQLRFHLQTYIGLAVFIKIVIENNVEPFRELSSQFSFYNGNIVLGLLRNITCQLPAGLVVVIYTEVLGIKIPPAELTVLHPVLPE